MLNQAARIIKKVVKPFATSDGKHHDIACKAIQILNINIIIGAGVALSRTIGGPRIDNFDPFLLLDEFKSENVSTIIIDNIYRYKY
jgi:hypothetical protein